MNNWLFVSSRLAPLSRSLTHSLAPLCRPLSQSQARINWFADLSLKTYLQCQWIEIETGVDCRPGWLWSSSYERVFSLNFDVCSSLLILNSVEMLKWRKSVCKQMHRSDGSVKWLVSRRLPLLLQIFVNTFLSQTPNIVEMETATWTRKSMTESGRGKWPAPCAEWKWCPVSNG